MKIGITTKYLTFENSFEKIRKIGYDGVDYTIGAEKTVFDEPRTAWIAHFRTRQKMLADCGLQIFQTHASYPSNIDREPRFSDSSFEQMKKEIEATAILGSPYVVIHPINFAIGDVRRDEEYAVNLEMYSRLESVLREAGVKLGIENMWIFDSVRNRYAPTSCALAEDMIKIIDELNSDRFVACLDTGHIHMQGYSPAAAVRRLGGRLKLMHAHDNYGAHDSHKAPGQGNIDWQDYAAALKEIGYDGAFSMELGLRREFAFSEESGLAYLRYAYAVAKEITECV